MLPGKKISPDFIIDVARRRWWVVAVSVAVCGFTALVVSALLLDVYEAASVLKIIPQRVAESLIRSTVPLQHPGVRMDAVAQQVITPQRLDQIIGEFGLYRDELGEQTTAEVNALMRKNVRWEMLPPPRGQLPDSFQVLFKYSDPALAARVADRLASLFVEENTRERGAVASETNAFLEARLKDARIRLEQQDRKLEAFRQRHEGRLPSQLASNQEQVRNTHLRIQSLADQTNRLRDQKVILERRYDDLQADPVPVVVAAAPPTAPASPVAIVTTGGPKEQLEAARTSLAALEVKYQPDHPDVRRLRATVAELQRKVQDLDATQKAASAPAAAPSPAPPTTPEGVTRRDRLREMRTDIERLDREIAANEAEERRLQAQAADYQTRVEAAPSLESEFTALTRENETSRNIFNDLLAKSNLSSVAADLERDEIGEQFHVTAKAAVPAIPVSPVRIQINAAGAGIGFLIGLAVVALLELRDSTFRTPSEVMETLSIPVMASVPFLESSSERKRRLLRQWMVSSAAMLAIGAGVYVFWAMRLWKSLL